LPDFPEVTGPEEFQPDILHLQHSIPSYAALLAFPGVPAIFHCHGGSWKDRPFLHPRVRHYLAISVSQAERMTIEMGVERDKISVHLNPIDTSRFQPGPPLAERSPAVLVYHARMAADDPVVIAIKRVTEQRKLRADFFGKGFGTSVLAPGQLLPLYPVVFASGISAMEAMACGCSVIVVGPGGCGEMVGSANFDRWRSFNFSIPLNCPPVTTDAVARALDSYDPADAAKVSQKIRSVADLQPSTRKLVEIYQSVIRSAGSLMPDPAGECLAAADFLRGLAPLVEARDRSQATAARAKEEQA
jgi:glycosyltransferase involved in cell wall biosynthesis